MPDNGWAASDPARSGTFLGVSEPFIDGGTSQTVFTTVASGVEQLHLMLSSVGGAVPAVAKGASTNTFASGGRVIQLADSAGNLRYASMRNGRIVLMAADGTVASDTLTTFTQATGLWQWGVFTVSIGATNRNRIYFSDAGNPTSWTSTNFFDVGPSWAPILSIVPTADVLYVASTDGWYAVSGVLGQNNVVRKVATTPLSGNDVPTGVGVTQMALATASQFGVSFMAAERGIRVLRGSSVADAARPFGIRIRQIVAAGDVLMALGSNSAGSQFSAWLWSEARRMWRSSTLPTGASLGYGNNLRYHQLVRDEGNRSTHLNVLANVGTYGSAEQVLVLRQEKEQNNPAAAGGLFPSATATLADYQTKAPFRVTEVVVEVDFGSAAAGGPGIADAVRSLSVQIATSPLTDQDVTLRRTSSGDPQPPASTSLTKTWSALEFTRAGDREMVRFKVNDAAPAMAAAPVLTLQGLKVRRVIMRCEEI
jgi:hypothetical protein